MKCLNCGARINKSEELCHECGAYISREPKPHILPSQHEDEEKINLEVLEKAEEAVRHIDNEDFSLKINEYNFRDYLLFPSLIKLGGGLALIIIVIYSYIKNPLKNGVINIFCFFGALFALFSGIASIIQERNCKLSVNNKKVYGTIPQGFFGTETIDINIEDIIGINETGFYSRSSDPKVHIVTKEKEITVKGSSQTMLSDLSENLKNILAAKGNINEN